MLELAPLVNQFTLFNKARDIGIKFGPNDLEVDKVLYFSVIKDSLEKEFERRRDAPK